MKDILLTPKTEWPLIEREPTTVAGLYTSYVIPLAAFASVCSFLRLSVVGISLPFGGVYRTPFFGGLASALISGAFSLLGLYLVGLIINALAPTFAGTRDLRQALKVAAYSFTSAWLGSLLGLLPVFATLLQFAAALYGIYLLYLGLPALMRVPREKAAGYTAAVVVATIVVGIVLGMLLASAHLTGIGRTGAFDSAGLTPQERQARAAAAVGSIIGGALGTDPKGKADISAAVSNLAAAGNQMASETAAANAANAANAAGTPATGGGVAAPGDVPADPATVVSAASKTTVAATANLLTALGGAMGGSRRVEPVDFHTLKDLLPDTLPGMTRTHAEGSSQQAMGVKSSSATATYEGANGARAEIKIADVSGVSGLLDAAGTLVQGVSSESDTGYERDATVAGRVMHEKYDNRSKHAELSVIVAKRFAVDVTGDAVDMKTLEQYASGVDMSKLDALKDAGAAGG